MSYTSGLGMARKKLSFLLVDYIKVFYEIDFTADNGLGVNSVGAKLRYMGYFASLLHPPGRKSWLLFSVRDMSGGPRNPCFTKFSVVNFL